MIANEAPRQEKKEEEENNVEEEGMEGRSVSHGDGPFGGCLADWLIDDPVAMLTDCYDGAFYSTAQLYM